MDSRSQERTAIRRAIQASGPRRKRCVSCFYCLKKALKPRSKAGVGGWLKTPLRPKIAHSNSEPWHHILPVKIVSGAENTHFRSSTMNRGRPLTRVEDPNQPDPALKPLRNLLVDGGRPIPRRNGFDGKVRAQRQVLLGERIGQAFGADEGAIGGPDGVRVTGDEESRFGRKQTPELPLKDMMPKPDVEGACYRTMLGSSRGHFSDLSSYQLPPNTVMAHAEKVIGCVQRKDVLHGRVSKEEVIPP